MQSDVTRCVICISNIVEYLNKEESHKNSTKEVTFEIKWSLSKQLYRLFNCARQPEN